MVAALVAQTAASTASGEHRDGPGNGVPVGFDVPSNGGSSDDPHRAASGGDKLRADTGATEENTSKNEVEEPAAKRGCVGNAFSL